MVSQIACAVKKAKVLEAGEFGERIISFSPAYLAVLIPQNCSVKSLLLVKYQNYFR